MVHEQREVASKGCSSARSTAEGRVPMRTLKTAMDLRSRAREVRTFHHDILRLLDVFAGIEHRQERLQIPCSGEKH